MQFLRFSSIGIVGFLADCGMLFIGLSIGLGPFWGRLSSFLFAVFVTWTLNRRFTFQEHSNKQGSDGWAEWIKYLMAMSAGGVINIMTYGLIMSNSKPYSLLPMVAVAIGSIAGLLINFSFAKFWVFNSQPHLNQLYWFEKFHLNVSSRDFIWTVLIQIFFWMSHLREADLPGLYMDAVNPDYLAAHLLNPEIFNPTNAMPSVMGPILGGVYHGTQNMIFGLPIFSILGFNLLSLRIAQGLFGAAILVVFQFALKRATESTWIAGCATLALATEIAFVASFRTQNYIVISGCVWFLGSLFLCFKSTQDKKTLFLSGLLLGLASYSYFVFVFFIPAWICLILLNTKSFKNLLTWVLGFTLGMQTYVIGYISLFIKLGGVEAGVNWLKQTLVGLSPISSELTVLDRVNFAWLYLRMAVHNWSNEQLIFNAVVSGSWVNLKFNLLLFSLLLLVALGSKIFKVTNASTPNNGTLVVSTSKFFVQPHQLIWLVISFFTLALIFGKRMGAHHFSVLIPLLYLILGIAVSLVVRKFPKLITQIFVAIFLVLLVALNQQQQNPFFQELEKTGGVGKSSNAINRLSEDAMALPISIVHAFPDWGFMMPFNFLTGNKRSFVLDISDSTLIQLKNENKEIYLVYWDQADAARHQEKLENFGYKVTEVTPYFERTHKPAFWVTKAKIK